MKKFLLAILCVLLIVLNMTPIYAYENPQEEVSENSVLNKEAIVDDMLIKLSADKGVLPDDASLKVRKVIQRKLFAISKSDEVQVSKDKLEKIENAISELREDEDVILSYTYDISIVNSKGEEIEPNGDVSISFSLLDTKKGNLSADIYHIDDNNIVTKLESDAKFVDGVAEYETTTNGFSYYQVEFTYNEIEYVLPSDTDLVHAGEYSKVLLKEVLEYLNIYGNVEDYSVSNGELFNIETIENELYLVSYKPFITKEHLYITVDGIEFDIVVTDAQGGVYTLYVPEGGSARLVNGQDEVFGTSGTISINGSYSDASLDTIRWYCYANSNHTNLINSGSYTLGQGEIKTNTACVICNPKEGDTQTVSSNNGTSATLYIDAAGGSCALGSITNTRSSDYITRTATACNVWGSWSTYSYGTWSDKAMPSCSKGNSTETKTVTLDAKGGTSVETLSTSATFSYSHTGFSNGLSAGDTWRGRQEEWTSAYYSATPISNYNKLYAPSASKSNYTFVGWDTDPSATTVVYKEGDELPLNNYTLYAVYEVQVNYYDGTSLVKSENLIVGTNVEYVYSKSGYTFNGWYKDTNLQEAHAGTVSENINLYASTTPIDYTITYNANGGENAPSSQVKTYDETLTLTSDTPIKTGYIFKGWSKDATSQSVEYLPNQEYNDEGQYADVTLYAKYSQISLNIAVNGVYNNEKISIDSIPYILYTSGEEVISGVLDEQNNLSSIAEKLVGDKTYILTLSDIYEKEFTIPSYAEDGSVEITCDINLYKRTIKVNNNHQVTTNALRVSLDHNNIKYNNFNLGVDTFDLNGGEEKDVYVLENVGYTVSTNEIYGYSTTLSDNYTQTPCSNNDEVIDVTNTPKTYKLSIHTYNAVFEEVNIEGIEYTIYDKQSSRALQNVLSDELGNIEFELQYGRDYYYKQTNDVYGYVVNQTSYDIVLPENLLNSENATITSNVALTPKTYYVIVKAVDDTNNPVIYAEFTAYDDNYEQIAYLGAVEPVLSCGGSDSVRFELTYGHQYHISQSTKVVGYDNAEDKKVIIPANYNFNEDGVVSTPLEIKSVLKGNKINVPVGSNVKTNYSIYNAQGKQNIEYKDGAYVLTYSQDLNNKYYIKADTPYAYKALPSQYVEIYYDGQTPLAKPIYFNFEKAKLEVNVANLVKNEKVHLYRYNSLVDTITSDGSSVRFVVEYGDGYAVKVTLPKEYRPNTTTYSVNSKGDYETGYVVAPTITPAHLLLETTKEEKKDVIGVDIHSYCEENEIENAKYSIYYKDSDKIAKDINGNELSDIGSGKYYLNTNKVYEVKQTAVSSAYVLNEEKQLVIYDDSLIYASVQNVKDYVGINFENSHTEEVVGKIKIANDKCKEARERLEEYIATYDENKYSKETWSKMLQAFEEARKEIEKTCAYVEKDYEAIAEYDIETLLAKLETSLSTYSEDASPLSALGQHIWHVVIIVISALTLLINLLLRKHGAGTILLITVLSTLVSCAIYLLLDRCLISLAAIIIHLIVELLLILILLLKQNKNDDGGGNDDDKNVKSQEEYVKPQVKKEPARQSDLSSINKEEVDAVNINEVRRNIQEASKDAEEYIKNHFIDA